MKWNKGILFIFPELNYYCPFISKNDLKSPLLLENVLGLFSTCHLKHCYLKSASHSDPHSKISIEIKSKHLETFTAI